MLTLMDNLTMFLRTFSGSFLSNCGLLLATFSISLYRLSSNDVVASSMKSDRPALVDIIRPRSFFWARNPKSRVRLPVPPLPGYDPPPPPPLPIVFADCITVIFSHSERPPLVHYTHSPAFSLLFSNKCDHATPDFIRSRRNSRSVKAFNRKYRK